LQSFLNFSMPVFLVHVVWAGKFPLDTGNGTVEWIFFFIGLTSVTLTQAGLNLPTMLRPHRLMRNEIHIVMEGVTDIERTWEEKIHSMIDLQKHFANLYQLSKGGLVIVANLAAWGSLMITAAALIVAQGVNLFENFSFSFLSAGQMYIFLNAGLAICFVLYRLSILSDACQNEDFTGDHAKSILAAAWREHRDIRDNAQLVGHDRFVSFVKTYPTGVRLFGVLITPQLVYTMLLRFLVYIPTGYTFLMKLRNYN